MKWIIVLAFISLLFISGAAKAALIYEDEFNDLTAWTGDVATGKWETTTTSPCSGTTSGFNKNTGSADEQMNTTQSTAGYTNIEVNITINTAALDSGEYIKIDWCNATTCTNLLTQQTDTSCSVQSFSLPSGADNTASFKIRAIGKSSANTEQIKLDLLRIHGTAIPASLSASNPTPSSAAIKTYQSTAFNGTCTAGGGTGSNANITIQDNRTGTFTDMSTSQSTAIFTNTSTYTIGSLSATSANYIFNVTANNTVGSYSIRLQCQATDTVPLAANSTTPSTLNVIQTNGTIEITTINTPTNLTQNIIQNQTFSLNATVTCQGENPSARCYQVNITARRNSTTVAIDTNISTTAGATPLWIMNGPITGICAGDMNFSQNCTFNWTINASGNAGLKINISANASSSALSIPTAQGNNISRVINITSPAVAADTSFTIYISAANATGYDTSAFSSTEQILFNSTNPNGIKINATAYGGANQSSTISMFRYENTGNTEFNITLAFGVAPTCSGGTITVKAGWADANYQDTCNNAIDASGCTEITTTAKHIAKLLSAGATRDVWLWADFSTCPVELDTSQTLTHTSVQPP